MPRKIYTPADTIADVLAEAPAGSGPAYTITDTDTCNPLWPTLYLNAVTLYVTSSGGATVNAIIASALTKTEYSVNAGGAWATVTGAQATRATVGSTNYASTERTMSLGRVLISDIRVRVYAEATATDVNGDSAANSAISTWRIEGYTPAGVLVVYI